MDKNNTKIKNKIRWGMLGCGNVTEIKSGPCYTMVEGFELRGVFNRTLEKARDYAKRHSVPLVFESVEAMLKSDEIDAIYIATPPDSHLEFARMVAKAGKPCCIEKPLAPNFVDAQSIHQLFSRANLPLFVAYYRRSLPRFNKVKDIIDSGALGKIRHLSWVYSRGPSELDKTRNYNWRTDKAIAAGGYFDDLASHGLDLFAFLAGNIERASGFCENQQGFYSAADAVVGAWVHSNGATGTGVWNFASEQFEDKVCIKGSEGSLTFSVFEECLVTLNSPAGQQNFVIENPVNVQFYHVENIRRHLAGEAPHPSLGESAVHTAWVMDRILGRAKS